jgi:hypothetical protein
MTDRPAEKDVRTLRWIAEEVKKQMEPVNKSVEEVKAQNSGQSHLLAMQVRKIDDIGARLKGLWGNGTGPPGYLENARKEDEKWKGEMFEVVSELRANVFREQGKKQLRDEQEEEKDRRIGRWKTYAYIAASLGGAWFWTLMRPLFHSMVDYLVKAMR